MHKLCSMAVMRKWTAAFLLTIFFATPITGVLAASTQPAPIQPPSGWPVRFMDDFSQDADNWPVGIEDNEWTHTDWEISAGKYTWKADAHQGFNWYVDTWASRVDDFYLSVEARLLSGPADANYGLAFRISDDGYYIFTIDDEGRYGLSCWCAGDWHELIERTTSPAIRPGEVNRVSVLAQGSHFSFAINDELVAELQDSKLAWGRVGLAIDVYEAGQQAVFEFDNFILHTPVDADSFFYDANALSRQDSYDRAIQYYQQALDLYRMEGDRAGESRALNNMGHSYAGLGEYETALEFIQQALDLYLELGNRSGSSAPLDGLAMVYRSLGDYAISLEYYQRTLEIYQEDGDLESQAIALGTMGEVSDDAGNYEQAIQFAQQAQELWKQLGIDDEQAWALNQIGYYYRESLDFEHAFEYYDKSLAIYESIEDEGGVAAVLIGIGWTHLQLSQQQYDRPSLIQAQEYLQRALALHQKNRNRNGEAEALHDLAIVHETMGDYKQALEYYQQVLQIWVEVENRTEEAWALNNIGWSRSKLFDYPGAMQVFDESLAIFRELEDRSAEAWVVGNIATVTADNLGYRKGMEYSLEQLKIYRELGDQAGEAEARNTLGKDCIIIGEYEQGLQYFQQAIEIWHANGDRINESRAINNIGVIYSYLGDNERALGYFEQSLKMSEEENDVWRGAIWRSNIGGYYLESGQYDKALEYSLKAHEIFVQVQEPRREYEASNITDIGVIFLEKEDYPQALSYMQEALAILQEVHAPQVEAGVLHEIGRLYFETKDYPAALEHLNQALVLWRQIGNPNGEADTLGLIGQVNEAMGNPDLALQAYLEAVSVRESVLGRVKAEAFQASLSAKGADEYQRAARLLAEKGDFVQAFDLSERNRARAFLYTLGNKRPELSESADSELLRQEEVLREEISALEAGLFAEKSKPSDQRSEQVLGSVEEQLAARQKLYEELLAKIQISSPEMASLVTISSLKVEEVQAALDDETTLVTYYMTDLNALAFVITSKDFQVVTLPAKPEEIAASVEGFRVLGLVNLENPHPRSLQDLYTWLVAPIKPLLLTPKVGIVPHQSLHYVPFSALYDGETYLGDQYVLFQLPSASALPYIVAESGQGGDLPLIMGNPQTDNPSLQNLEFAAQEARQIADLYGNQALVGEQASEQALRTQIGAAGFLHLAAHGSLNPNAPQFSRLWLAPAGSQDGRLNLYEVYGLDLEHANLVVLSACQTQLGDVSAGDEVVSLNRAFLYNVPTVVSSLWSVNDEATGALMLHFYTYIREGEGKAEALRHAQIELRNDPQHPEWTHPYYWAAFVLNGDAGPVNPSKPKPQADSGFPQADPGFPSGLLIAILAGGGVLVAAGLVIFLISRRRGAH